MRSLCSAILIALAGSGYAGAALSQDSTDGEKKPLNKPTANLEGVSVVGDWLAEADQNVVVNHAHPDVRAIRRVASVSFALDARLL